MNFQSDRMDHLTFQHERCMCKIDEKCVLYIPIERDYGLIFENLEVIYAKQPMTRVNALGFRALS